MNPTQGNTRPGNIRIKAAQDLSSLEGRLCKLVPDAFGTATAKLPEASTDLCLYLVDDGNDANGLVTVKPLEPGQQFRIRAKGAGAVGDVLVQADPATAADRGKVRKLPNTAGTYRAVAVAEEKFVEGQLVLCRVFHGSFTVA